METKPAAEDRASRRNRRRAEEVAAAVVSSLDSSARRWAGTDAVRFVAEIAIVHRWSEAK